MLKSRFWKNFDWVLFGSAFALALVGVVVIYSTSFKAANLIAPVDAAHQVYFLVVALIGFGLAARMDYRGWAKLTPALYIAMLISLLLVFVLGKTALGATRWIDLGFFQFQPSESAKIIMILVLAKYFSANYDAMDRPRVVIVSLLYVLVPALLVLAQPDLGTALVFGAIWLVMAIIAQVRWSYFAVLFGLVLVSLPIFIQFVLKPYQRDRLEVFLNPASDPLSSGYNVVQSTIAVGSGQLFGRGLAAGSQSQLNFLPSQHTDFIFAVLSEKMGFVGGIIVLLLFAVLLLRAIYIASRAEDRFGVFVAVGVVTMILFHLFINVGMNVGLMPVTGIPLPFISYGGTSLLVSLIAVGLLESIAVRRKKIQFNV